MVQFIPARNGWSEAFERIGSGVSEGYTNRTDDLALQKAIQELGDNPSPKQLLDTITGTKTYSQKSKQNLLKNYLGTQEFEELKRKNKVAEETQNAKREIDANKEANKLKQDIGSAKALIESIDMPEDSKQALYAKIDAGEIGFDAVKEITKNLKPDEKKVAKEDAAKAGLDVIKRMREIGKGGNLGRGSGFLKMFGGKGAKDFGEYEQLGKSLIQLSTTIPIRNRQEFETLAHNLYDPTIPDAEREGVLDAIEKIIQGTLPGQKQESTGDRPPLESFMR